MNLMKRAENEGVGVHGFIVALKSHMIYLTDVWISFPENPWYWSGVRPGYEEFLKLLAQANCQLRLRINAEGKEIWLKNVLDQHYPTEI